MFNRLKAKAAAAVTGLASVFGAGSAMAAMDVTSVTTAITDAGVAVATIGAAVLIIIFGAKAWKWVRSAG